MTQSNTMHVVFGSGPLGLSVVDELLARGKPVRLVNRSGKANVPTGVEVIGADAFDPRQAQEACANAGYVYQCAQPPYQHWVTQFPPFQENILNAAAACGARLIVGDNLYMYGEVDGRIHEALPNAARTRKGRTRARMAEAVLVAHCAGKVNAVIARGADFFGPRVLGSVLGERVFIPALRGKTARFVGRLDQPHTFTYIADFGKAMLALAENDSAFGQIWHVPNAETLTQRQVGDLIFAIFGTPPKMSAMGRLMMGMGGLFIPEARETLEMMYQFEKPFVVDSSKFTHAFGMTATPLRDALSATIAWYRGHLDA